MFFNGSEVPYISVSSDFARNPASYDYELSPRASGGGRIRNKRMNAVEISIPVIYSRRGFEGSAWEDIKTELSGMLYRESKGTIHFSRNDVKHYMAKVVAIEFMEEYEYAAKGNIVLVAEYPGMLGEAKTIKVTTSAQPKEITGQTAAPWTSKTVFGESASQYVMTVNNGLNIELNYDFIAGDVLRIDADRRLVTVNGYDKATSVSLDTNWLGGELKPGSFAVNASHATEIYYTERFY